MRRIFLLFASVSLAVLVACGVALAVTPTEEMAGNVGDDATTTAARGPKEALDRALKELVAMEGAPPESSPWSSAARSGRCIPSA